MFSTYEKHFILHLDVEFGKIYFSPVMIRFPLKVAWRENGPVTLPCVISWVKALWHANALGHDSRLSAGWWRYRDHLPALHTHALCSLGVPCISLSAGDAEERAQKGYSFQTLGFWCKEIAFMIPKTSTMSNLGNLYFIELWFFFLQGTGICFSFDVLISNHGESVPLIQFLWHGHCVTYEACGQKQSCCKVSVSLDLTFTYSYNVRFYCNFTS